LGWAILQARGYTHFIKRFHLVPAKGLLYLAVLVTFATYARGINLMLLHDDVINALWMRNYTPLSIFAPFTFGGAWARPLANSLWLLVRDAFGVFDPAIIHAINILLHTLCAALTGKIAIQLAQRINGQSASLWVGALAALIFGLFPFSFQTVLWAGAIYHPLMAACGLIALWLSLKPNQTAASQIGILLALILADLSHDAGFQFALLLGWVHLLLAWIERRRIDRNMIGLGLIAVVFALFYRWLLQRQFAPDNTNGTVTLQPLADVWKNFIIFAQGWVYWLVVPLRQWLGLTDAAPAWIAALFAASLGLVGWLLHRWRALLLLLGAWLILSLPAILLLNEAYVRFGPRLLYSSAIVVAWFWAFGLMALAPTRKRALPLRRISQIAMALVWLIVSVWDIRYVTTRLRETERLTPGLRQLIQQVRTSQDNNDLLIINLPWWNAPSNPSFWVGAEGMPLFQHLGAPAWTWVGMQAGGNGIERNTAYLTHIASRGQFGDWVYGTPGDEVDDAGLRARLLDNLQSPHTRYINRFVYDAPGVRLQPLAELRLEPTRIPAQYTFTDEKNPNNRMEIIAQPVAHRCDTRILLNLDWHLPAKLRADVAVFVHGLNAAGEQVLVADVDPVGGYLPISQWPAPFTVHEQREIRLPEDGRDVNTLQIGLYRRDNGQRLVVTRLDGSRVENDAVLTPIEGCAS